MATNQELAAFAESIDFVIIGTGYWYNFSMPDDSEIQFKIKTVKGIDDYAMIAEVVKRRYKYAMRGEELWPDLVLIDGGLGHLRAAEKAFKEMEAPAVTIASIAKREEDIYIQGTTKPLKLSANSPVRKLLQYIRDEAHRFAQHYHHILRGKKMLK